MRTSFFKIFFILLLMSAGYSIALAQENRNLTYEEFIKKAKETKGTIIDARTPQEYSAGHLSNSVLINFLASNFAENIDKLDREGHYFLYCRSGNRTNKALSMMQEMGFKNIYHLKGGVIGINQSDVLVKE